MSLHPLLPSLLLFAYTKHQFCQEAFSDALISPSVSPLRTSVPQPQLSDELNSMSNYSGLVVVLFRHLKP